MKLTFILLTVALLQVSAKGISQTITYSGKDVKLETVFSEIKKQTGYVFFYSSQDMALSKLVTVRLDNSPVEVALKEVLNNQPLTFIIKDKTVFIKAKPVSTGVFEPPVTTNDILQNTTIDISGKVTDKEGNPLQGASITVKGKANLGTKTDAGGVFILKGVEADDVITVSYAEYISQTFKVGSTTNFMVKMEASEGNLQEVVINKGYYTEKQRYSVSNVGKVTAKEIENQPVLNPLISLQGRLAGVQVTQANGIPGGGVTIRIQGRNNLNSLFTGSDPLIIIDGVPYPSQNLNTFRGGLARLGTGASILGNSNGATQGPQGSPLSYINTSDIESIEVLKDADATAIYGSRAANGAVLITTKRAKVGKTKLDLNFQTGWGKVARKMELLNSQQYMEMRREAKRNDAALLRASDYDLRGLWDTTRYTDWQEVLLGGTARYNNYSASLSGGVSQIQYLIKGTYGKETSVFPGDFSDSRGAIHFNLNAYNTSRKLNVQLTGNYMADNNQLPGDDYTSIALGLAPVAPALYNNEGKLNWAPDPNANGNSSWTNPLANIYSSFNSKTDNLVTNLLIQYQLLNGLDIKCSFGYSNLETDQFLAPTNEALKPEERVNRVRTANFSFNGIKSWIIEPQITYYKKISKSKIDILLGASTQKQNNEGRAFNASGQPSDLLLKHLGAATSVTTQSDISVYKYAGVFARFNYNLKDKYLFNLTGRRDGSSRFGPQNRYNNFGAVGLGWIFGDEKFIRNNVPFLSFGKIRGSYGTSGNDQIGNYQYFSLYTPLNGSVPFQGSAGLQPGNLSNPYLEWEETKKLQAGIDLGFWNNRLIFSANYIQNRSSNNLSNVDLPSTTGFTRFTDNIQSVVGNTGWEFQLKTEIIQRQGFSWSTSVNLTVPKNKLISFPDLETSTLFSELVLGQPLNIERNYYFAGIDPSTGQWLVKDKFGNPTSNPNFNQDAVFAGIRDPKYYGGLFNTIRYKQLQLDILVQFANQKANDILWITGYPGSFNVNFFYGNQPVSVLSRWQKPGDIKEFGKFSTNSSSPTSGNYSFRDASYLSLENISLSYDLSNNLAKGIFRTCVMYLNAQNVLTITKYQGLDPETRNTSSLPPLRMITTGLRIGL